MQRNLCCAVAADTGNEMMFFGTTDYAVASKIVENAKAAVKKMKVKEMLDVVVRIGLKQIVFYYAIFVGIGLLINRVVPSSIITGLFSGGSLYSVPLAAFIGLPLYINGESALPLIKSLMESGAGGGAMLAFLITGPGTSAGVIAGISTIMKRRAIVLYVAFLLVGGILLGYLYDFLLALGV